MADSNQRISILNKPAPPPPTEKKYEVDPHGNRIYKSGWLYREEAVQGSLTTWKKRWNTVTLQSFQSFKNNTATEAISSLHVSQIEEYAHGANIGDKTRTFAFSLTTPRGMVRLAAESEEDREKWISIFRILVPKAKVELAKEMLLRKVKRKANLELAQQQIKEAIESILRNAKRVAVRDGFKDYADGLAESLQILIKNLDSVSQFGMNSAKHTAYAVASVVDAANSVAAVSTNRAIQDEIVIRSRDIGVDTAEVLIFSLTAPTDGAAKKGMMQMIDSIHEQIAELLQLLNVSGQLEYEMDTAKIAIEKAIENVSSSVVIGEMGSVEATNEFLSDRAKVLSTTIKNIANSAFVTPERVGEYSKEAAELMCEILDGTSVVAIQCGVDINDPAYLAGTSDINPAKRQQIETLLAAAKGFAAATTNIIDLLRQVPEQEDDENIQFRLSMATRSADNALNAFVSASNRVNTKASNGPNDASFPQIDADAELLNALNAIENHVKRFSSVNHATNRNGPGGAGGINGGKGPNGNRQADLVEAAKTVGKATHLLMTTTKNAHDEIRRVDPRGYKNDPNWTSGLVAAAQALAQTTGQLVDLSCDPSTSSETIVAAARCVDDASARLAGFTRAKGDPNSSQQHAVEDSIRALTKATNALVDIAKSDQDDNSSDSLDLNAIKNADKSKQHRLEFEAQAAIAKLEAELDEAREYMVKLKRVVYGGDN